MTATAKCFLPDGLEALLVAQPGLAARPVSRTGDITLEGRWQLDFDDPVGGHLVGEYELRIVVPQTFPLDPPKVYEIGGTIPREPDFHISRSGSICLSSPLSLRLLGHRCPDLLDYLNECLPSYLYAAHIKRERGGPWPFPDLAHGVAGTSQEYAELLQIPLSSVPDAIKLLRMRKRLANKKPCPCRCGRRLGRCATRLRIQALQKSIPRRWFTAEP